MRNRNLLAAVAATALLGTGVIAFQSDRFNPAPEPLPEVPQALPIELVEVQPFTLETPSTHWMRAEAPSYSEGHVVVLRADPTLLLPRQTYENVLYVGAETATRVNTGERSGHLVAIVPGDVDPQTVPIFLGEPALPENVTADEAARQLGLAVTEGARAQAALEPVGASVHLADGYELKRFASYLVERYSPDESSLIEGLRVPRLDFR